MEETRGPLRSHADTHSPHSDDTSSTSYSRRYSSSHHAPKLINRLKDAPHPCGAQSRSHLCTSSYQGRRCSCTSARRNACARGGGVGGAGAGEKGGIQQRSRRHHCPCLVLVLVHCASAIASASYSLAGVSGFSCRPLSFAIPELWVSKSQVGCGEGLSLVVVGGRVKSRPGREYCS
jgi:hypothetical protein